RAIALLSTEGWLEEAVRRSGRVDSGSFAGMGWEALRDASPQLAEEHRHSLEVFSPSRGDLGDPEAWIESIVTRYQVVDRAILAHVDAAAAWLTRLEELAGPRVGWFHAFEDEELAFFVWVAH